MRIPNTTHVRRANIGVSNIDLGLSNVCDVSERGNEIVFRTPLLLLLELRQYTFLFVTRMIKLYITKILPGHGFCKPAEMVNSYLD